MVPQTLANWDAYAMQDAAVRAALGVAPAHLCLGQGLTTFEAL